MADSAPATDQRGRPRVSGAAIDAGAVERQPGDPLPAPRPIAPKGFTAGSDAGQTTTVQTFNPDGTKKLTLTPFGGDFTGGVRVALAAR